MNVGFTQNRTSWGYEKTELLANRGENLINKIIKPRRWTAAMDQQEELDQLAWECPDASDDLNPLGLTYWIVKNATAGFNGGLPPGKGYTTKAGVNLTTVPNFKNRTGTYAEVSDSDLLEKMSDTLWDCNWGSPNNKESFIKFGDRYRIWVKRSTYNAMKRLAKAQNEDIGGDLDKMEGQFVFQKHPIVPVRYWETVTDFDDEPVYMVNHDSFYTIVMSGMYFMEEPPIVAQDNQLGRVVAMYVMYQFICANPRLNGVLYKV